jgi:hypothetical protein
VGWNGVSACFRRQPAAETRGSLAGCRDRPVVCSMRRFGQAVRACRRIDAGNGFLWLNPKAEAGQAGRIALRPASAFGFIAVICGTEIFHSSHFSACGAGPGGVVVTATSASRSASRRFLPELRASSPDEDWLRLHGHEAQRGGGRR